MSTLKDTLGVIHLTRKSELKSELAGKRWICVEFPVVEYKDVLDLQQRLVAARNNEIIGSDIILLLEHSPVFTLGLRGGFDNLKVSRAFLAKQGIAIIQSERGGDITFHGPGQLVAYPIIDLKKSELKVLNYVAGLEEIMIRVAADWGIMAKRNPANRGIWVGNSKLGSVGISVRKGICFHGFALNVNIEMEPFEWMNPCGLKDCGVTSMIRELSQKISINQVRKAVKSHIEAVFGVTLVLTSLSELQELITGCIPQKTVAGYC
jgi:lipoate-protein ligase B